MTASIRVDSDTPFEVDGTIKSLLNGRVGECYVLSERLFDPDIEVVFDHGRVVPCSRPHNGEVVFADHNYFAKVDEVPTQFTDAAEPCIEKLEGYTALPYETSPFQVYWLSPTDVTWEAGDRSLVCVGLTLDEDLATFVESTESMRAG